MQAALDVAAIALMNAMAEGAKASGEPETQSWMVSSAKTISPPCARIRVTIRVALHMRRTSLYVSMPGMWVYFSLWGVKIKNNGSVVGAARRSKGAV